MSFPSNFILLNTIIILENPKKINDEYINNFLNQYETNIYISQGTIMKSIETENFFLILNPRKNDWIKITFILTNLIIKYNFFLIKYPL